MTRRRQSTRPRIQFRSAERGEPPTIQIGGRTLDSPLAQYLSEQLAAYVPPPHPKRGFSRERYIATLLTAMTCASVQDVAKAARVGYGVLRTWRTDPRFSEMALEMTRRLAPEFAERAWQAFAAGAGEWFRWEPRLYSEVVVAAICAVAGREMQKGWRENQLAVLLMNGLARGSRFVPPELVATIRERYESLLFGHIAASLGHVQALLQKQGDEFTEADHQTALEEAGVARKFLDLLTREAAEVHLITRGTPGRRRCVRPPGGEC